MFWKLFIIIGGILFLIVCIDFIMPDRWAFTKKIKKSKIYDVVPGVVFSLCLGLVTIYLTPRINQKFEQQKIGSEYLLGILNNLKTDTLTLYMDVQELTDCLENITEPERKVKQDILKLRYRAEEIEALIGQDDALQEFSTSLTCIRKNLTPENREKRYECLSDFIKATKKLSISIVDKSHIKTTYSYK